MKRIVYIVSFIFSQNKTLQKEGSAIRTERTVEYDKKKRDPAQIKVSDKKIKAGDGNRTHVSSLEG